MITTTLGKNEAEAEPIEWLLLTTVAVDSGLKYLNGAVFGTA